MVEKSTLMAQKGKEGRFEIFQVCFFLLTLIKMKKEHNVFFRI